MEASKEEEERNRGVVDVDHSVQIPVPYVSVSADH